ncbi:F0F1 ATP synthase subunit delta [Dermabacteraceae bacterium P13095]
MRGTSAQSFQTVRDSVRGLLAASDIDSRLVADELFSVAELIDSTNRLVRVLSDIGQSEDTRAQIVDRLLGDHVTPVTKEIVTGLVRQRWSLQDDLLEAITRIGVDCVLLQAQAEGTLDTVEQQLFQVSHLISENPALAEGLNAVREDSERRVSVLRSLLSEKLEGDALLLVSEAAKRPGELKVAQRVREFAELAASLRGRTMAVVYSAIPLTQAQQQRLADILQKMYGTAVQLNLLIDPEVVGGLRITVGDDLYDATIMRRLDDSRRRLTS